MRGRSARSSGRKPIAVGSAPGETSNRASCAGSIAPHTRYRRPNVAAGRTPTDGRTQPVSRPAAMALPVVHGAVGELLRAKVVVVGDEEALHPGLHERVRLGVD